VGNGLRKRDGMPAAFFLIQMAEKFVRTQVTVSDTALPRFQKLESGKRQITAHANLYDSQDDCGRPQIEDGKVIYFNCDLAQQGVPTDPKSAAGF